jgi:hypothetical protein
METSCNLETRTQFYNALDTLVIQADENDVLPDKTTSFVVAKDNTDTHKREVIIHPVQD